MSVYTYIYIYIHVFIYIYIYIYTYTYIYIYIYIHKDECVYIYTHSYIYIYIYYKDERQPFRMCRWPVARDRARAAMNRRPVAWTAGEKEEKEIKKRYNKTNIRI